MEDIKKMNKTTPTSINKKILNFCKKIDPTTEPIFVNFTLTEGSINGECYGNVENYIKKNGGGSEDGWIIWETPNVWLEAEFHRIWVNNEGEYIDITPKNDGESKILFLKDSKRKFTGELIDNIRKPLVDNAETRTTVVFAKKNFELREKYYDGKLVVIPIFELNELDDLGKKFLLQEIRKDILNGKRKIGRNEPCYCGSNKKYKKCCISD